MISTKNNHYISQYLTRPWEFTPGKVRIFDYSNELFADRDTKTLFSKEGLFTQEQEGFFNLNIERITSQELLKVAEKKFKIKKWKSYRALLLFVFDLVSRYSAALREKHD